MESTVSVSKGVFLFKNDNKKKSKSSKTSRKSLFEQLFTQEPWYTTYYNNWRSIENQLRDLNNNTYSVILNDMVSYIKSFYNTDENVLEGIVPSATLLTGVNQPDHCSQFMALIVRIREDVTPHTAMVHSQDAPTVKHLMENIIWQLVNEDSDSFDSEDLDGSFHQTKKLRKNQCTMATLVKWYSSRYLQPHTQSSPTKKKRIEPTKKTLVIIIPDFESFNCNVLQDFVMIMSNYVPRLPLLFVFGVATSVSALHKSFPYHVSSKLLIKVFYSQSSPVYLNQVLEELFLTHTNPFQLSGRAMELLTDVFLFYDFSVTGLVRSLKYCMMDHFYGDNIKSLCCAREDLQQAILNLDAEDLESIRQLPSFRPYLESQDCKTKIKLFEDDDYFKEALYTKISELHDYLYTFFTCLRLLASFFKELPKNLLGKTVRELYVKCISEDVTQTPDYRECMQLVHFQSQMKIIESLKNAVKIIKTSQKSTSPVKPFTATPTKNNISTEKTEVSDNLGQSFVDTVKVHLYTFIRQIKNANTEASILGNTHLDENAMLTSPNVPGNRYKLKEQLLKATKVDKVQSEYEMVRSRLLSCLEEVFAKGLKPAHTQTFHELFFFNDVAHVRKQIIGSPRGAVHTALSNPVHYLQCKCCHLPAPDSVVDSLPDVCLAYKLHRECGKHINLYDWLQAFAAVLQPSDDDEERRHVDPVIQLRFTRAVSELQFLGFIKSSKRKTDHVMRLTW